MQPPTEPFIDGQFCRGAGEALTLVNPATEEAWCEVSPAGAADVGRAVAGAQRAFDEGWRDLPPGKRTEALFSLSRLIRENVDELAQLDVRSVGKPIADARDEVALGA